MIEFDSFAAVYYNYLDEVVLWVANGLNVGYDSNDGHRDQIDAFLIVSIGYSLEPNAMQIVRGCVCSCLISRLWNKDNYALLVYTAGDYNFDGDSDNMDCYVVE